jgi:hypothetical protein
LSRLVLARRAPPPEERAPDDTWVPWDAEDTPVPGEETAREEIEEAAIAWTKGWGRQPLEDGRAFRDILEWKGISLWWFAELYLHHGTSCPGRVRLIEVVHRLIDAHAPDEVEAVGLPREEALLVGRVCTARGVLFHGPAGAGRARASVWRTSARSRWNAAKVVLGSLKAALQPPPPAGAGDRRTLLFLSHAAFWRSRRDPETGELVAYEHYFDRLIPSLQDEPELRPVTVAVGPEAAHRRRGLRDRLREWLLVSRGPRPYVPIGRHATARVRRATGEATRLVRHTWRRLRRLPSVRQAFSHRGVPFFDLAEGDFAGMMLLQLPWAAHAYELTAATLEDVRPAAACLYAESSGWGRAALAACEAAGVPTVAVQHGILYPSYFSYRHEADEDACPRPTRTAVFGEAARRFLIERGRYRPESLVATGSPKFDELLARARRRPRDELRRQLGVGDGQKLVAVASRYRPIRRTHRALGPVFADLLRALGALPGVAARIKPHPAEPPEAYDEDLRAAGLVGVRRLDGDVELPDLLHAADVLVTVESLSAVEALVLGRPVVVLNMPCNLRELVEAGVAVGVAAGDDPAPALASVLFDPATADRLGEARARYVSDFAMGVDGQATRRILDLVRAAAGVGAAETARARGVVA